MIVSSGDSSANNRRRGKALPDHKFYAINSVIFFPCISSYGKIIDTVGEDHNEISVQSFTKDSGPWAYMILLEMSKKENETRT